MPTVERRVSSGTPIAWMWTGNLSTLAERDFYEHVRSCRYRLSILLGLEAAARSARDRKLA